MITWVAIIFRLGYVLSRIVFTARNRHWSNASDMAILIMLKEIS